MRPRMAPLFTERLTIRPLRLDDLQSVFSILSCGKTSGGHIFEKKTVDEARSWLQKRIRDEEQHGFSMWAVETRAGQVIGFCGFFKHTDGLELGYIIKHEFQNQGFALEAVRASIDAAVAGGYRVFATIRPSNPASIRVAEKAGLRRCPDEISPGDPDLIVFRR